jgi:hypothetical protein
LEKKRKEKVARRDERNKKRDVRIKKCLQSFEESIKKLKKKFCREQIRDKKELKDICNIPGCDLRNFPEAIMIECDICKQWVHAACQDEAWKSLVQEDFSNIDFECDECKDL